MRGCLGDLGSGRGILSPSFGDFDGNLASLTYFKDIQTSPITRFLAFRLHKISFDNQHCRGGEKSPIKLRLTFSSAGCAGEQSSTGPLLFFGKVCSPSFVSLEVDGYVNGKYLCKVDNVGGSCCDTCFWNTGRNPSGH